MALEGSIRDFSLADIFQLIGIQRKTGVLTLRHQDEEVKVSFLNGLVVNADSKLKRLDDRLGNVLVKTGKLSPDALKRALKVQKETLKKIGSILVEENLVRNDDLREALGIQITQIIYRLFRWKDGDYHFEQDVAVDYDKENFAPMSAESILMEGMRMIDEWPIIERKITSFEMVFERVPLEGDDEPQVDDGAGDETAKEDGQGKEDDFDLIFGGEKGRNRASDEPSRRIKLTREENTVYQQVNGKATVQEIVDRTMLSEFEICRALYDLMSRNLIAPVTSATRSSPDEAKKSRDLGGLAAILVYVALVVALGVSLAMMTKNPYNLLAPPFKGATLERLKAELAPLKVKRVAEAIDAYALVNKGYPSKAEDLLKDGLLRPEDLLDPWGEPIRMEVRPDRIVVSSRSAPAEGAKVITEERPIRG